jgi:hypothetical protein
LLLTVNRVGRTQEGRVDWGLEGSQTRKRMIFETLRRVERERIESMRIKKEIYARREFEVMI